MQLNVTASILKTMVKAFSKVVSTRCTLPVLGYILFRYEPDESTVSATVTNLDETLTFHLPPEAAIPGTGNPDAFLCPFSELRNLAVNLPANGSVLLTPEGESAVIAGTHCGVSLVQREFGAMPVAEFPGTDEPIVCAAADIGLFLKGYRTVLPAASPDETRVVLHGVVYDHQNSCVAATDSRRLMLMPISQLPIGGDLILPQSRIMANGILDEETGGAMGVHVKEGGGRPRLELQTASWTYRVQCIEGNYPNYRQVIPPETSSWLGEFRFDPQDLPLLKLTIRQYTDADHNGIGLVTDGTRLMLIKTSVNSDGKPPYVELPHSRVDAKAPALLTVNAQYFMEGIAAGCLRMRYFDCYSPVRCENAETGTLYVLMPLRDPASEVTRFVDETFRVPVIVPTTQEETDMARNSKSNEAAPSQVTAPVVAAGKPEANTTATPDAATQVAPVTAAASVTADADKTPGTAPASPTAETGAPTDGKNGLQLLPPENPEEALVEGIQSMQDKLTALQNDLRTLKQQVRAVEKYYRTRARDIESKSQLITRFQKAVGF